MRIVRCPHVGCPWRMGTESGGPELEAMLDKHLRMVHEGETP